MTTLISAFNRPIILPYSECKLPSQPQRLLQRTRVAKQTLRRLAALHRRIILLLAVTPVGASAPQFGDESMSAPFHVDASVRGRLAYRAKRGLGAGNLEASEETGTTIPVELATFGAVPQRRRGAPGAAPLGGEDRRFRKRSADGWPRVEQENSAFGNASSSDWRTVGVVEIAGTTMRRAPGKQKQSAWRPTTCWGRRCGAPARAAFYPATQDTTLRGGEQCREEHWRNRPAAFFLPQDAERQSLLESAPDIAIQWRSGAFRLSLGVPEMGFV